jgi:DNA invertase Pin-like site-specific DNA recombinase
MERGDTDTSGLEIVSKRAAEYVRMSSDHQKYSIANQSLANHAYAAARGLTIVRTYADEGRSGLDIGGRKALKQLIADVQPGSADFKTILVYDVSRWGIQGGHFRRRPSQHPPLGPVWSCWTKSL